LEGASYPGIVYNVTSLLAKHGLNIDTMGTVEEIAPHGGTHLFRMKGVAHAFDPLPKSFSSDKIRDELRELGDSLNCDITLEDVHEDSYSGSFYVD
jgi:glycine cleavage system transcriptional repressor